MVKFIDIIEDNNRDSPSDRLFDQRLHKPKILKMCQKDRTEHSYFKLHQQR